MKVWYGNMIAFAGVVEMEYDRRFIASIKQKTR